VITYFQVHIIIITLLIYTIKIQKIIIIDRIKVNRYRIRYHNRQCLMIKQSCN
jgi:hypothetical protein